MKPIPRNVFALHARQRKAYTETSRASVRRPDDARNTTKELDATLLDGTCDGCGGPLTTGADILENASGFYCSFECQFYDDRYDNDDYEELAVQKAPQPMMTFGELMWMQLTKK